MRFPVVYRREWLARFSWVNPVLVFGTLVCLLCSGGDDWIQHFRVQARTKIKSADIPAGRPIFGRVDALGNAQFAADRKTIFASRGADIHLAGWAVSALAEKPLQGLAVVLDGRTVAEEKYFELRPDIAAEYGRPDFVFSGWSMDIALQGVAMRTHSLEIAALTQDQRVIVAGFQLRVVP